MAPINKDLNFNIRVNQATAQRANAAASTLIDRLKDLKAESQQLRVDSDQLSASWRAFAASADAHDALKDAKRELTLLEKELRKVQATTEDTDKTFKNANGVNAYETRIKQAARDTELYGDVGSRVRDIGGVAGLVGGAGVDRAFMVGGDLLDAAEGLGRIKAELPALISQLGITPTQIGLAVAAVATLAATIKIFAKGAFDAAERTKEAVVGQISAVEQFNQASYDATTAQARANAVAAQRDLEIARRTQEDLKALKDAVDAGLDVRDQDVVGELGEVVIRGLDYVGLMGIGLDELDDAIGKAGASVTENQALLNLWTGYIGSNNAALYDEIDALDKASSERAASAKENARLYQLSR